HSAQVPVKPQQTPKVSIEGIVVRIGTADAIPGARVTLVRVQAPVTALPAAPPPPSGPQLGAGAVSVTQSASGAPAPSPAALPAVYTDSKGNFTFKDIEA